METAIKTWNIGENNLQNLLSFHNILPNREKSACYVHLIVKANMNKLRSNSLWPSQIFFRRSTPIIIWSHGLLILHICIRLFKHLTPHCDHLQNAQWPHWYSDRGQIANGNRVFPTTINMNKCTNRVFTYQLNFVHQRIMFWEENVSALPCRNRQPTGNGVASRRTSLIVKELFMRCSVHIRLFRK